MGGASQLTPDVAQSGGRNRRIAAAVASVALFATAAIVTNRITDFNRRQEPDTNVAARDSFGSGQQVVGKDVQPGLYRTAGAAGERCYFERLIGLTGEITDIIANGNSEGPVIIEIAPTDAAFNSRGCQRWSVFRGGDPIASFGDGDWAVGAQLTPGRWSTDGDPASIGCFWERASGFAHMSSETVANGVTEGYTIVDVGPNDRLFVAHGCGTWTRIG